MTNLLTEDTILPAPPPRKRPRVWPTALLAAAITAAGAALIALAMSLGPTGRTSPTVETSASGGTATIEETSLATGAVIVTDVSDVAADVVDSVVVVEVSSRFRGREIVSGSGSGVILDADGTIVTNAHVIDGAASITVELTDGSTYAATVVTMSGAEDIAILDIDAEGLDAIDIGTTEGLLVGDPVIAVGNPLALEGGPSVTTGIVSALDRVLEDEDTSLDGVIQTDAAITQGSSGGALLDTSGELIGMTTAVGVSSVGAEGIAFAIPVEAILAVLGGTAA